MKSSQRFHQTAVPRGGRRVVLIAAISSSLLAPSGWGAVTDVIGSYGNWPTTWQPLAGINDTVDGGLNPELDFVGDASNTMLYQADNGSYLFCRMRLNVDAYAPPLSASYLWLIDVVGVGKAGIDAAFAWDAKSNNSTTHGLEMGVAGTNGPTWGVSQLDDLDGASGSKGISDINGNGRTTDGYVRVIDGQSTSNFGNTTFIDFAISWSYLQTYTILAKDQDVMVNVATINNATDHNVFNADIGNNASPSDLITTAWSSPITIPEPSSLMLLGVASGMGLLYRRRSVTQTIA